MIDILTLPKAEEAIKQTYKTEKEWLKDRDKHRLVLHEIVAKSAFRKGRKIKWIHVSRDEWRTLIGYRKCKSILEHQVQAGVLEINHKYSCGFSVINGQRVKREGQQPFTKSYSIVKEYFHSPAKINEIEIKPRQNEIEKGNWEKVHHQLWDCLKEFTIVRPPERLLTMLHPSQTAILTEIQSGVWRMIRDDYGRVHTNFTTLSRNLRKHLLCRGTKLAFIDIANSQPLLLGVLLQKKIGRVDLTTGLPLTHTNTYNSKSNTHTNRENTLQGHNHYKWIHFDKSAHNRIGFTETEINETEKQIRLSVQLEDYLGWCQRGLFYEHLARLCKDLGIPIGGRTHFKTKVLATLYDDWNEVEYSLPILNVFRIYYSDLYSMMDEMKWFSYKDLPRDMQRTESDLVILRVCAELFRLYPDIPLLTLHDSIYTIPEYIDRVEEVFQQVFHSYNIYPTFSKGTYNEDKRTDCQRVSQKNGRGFWWLRGVCG